MRHSGALGNMPPFTAQTKLAADEAARLPPSAQPND
jgi:hypothetical protein